MPLVGCARPSSRRMSVVLPAPFGPRNPNAQPRGTSRSMLLERRAVAEALAEAGGLDGEMRSWPNLRRVRRRARLGRAVEPRGGSHPFG